MFIAMVRFPDVPSDRDAEFRDWFEWSNQELAGTQGLRGRRLLYSADDGYCALVEHESARSFTAMHGTSAAARVQTRLRGLVAEAPQATQFEVVAALATGGCCREDGNHQHSQDDDEHSVPESDADVVAGHACCQAG
ncbi:antibiotic biosynthesis monooxygenase [Intrasporangium chromatireducens Q5-1]|uniref:Antibiotic biosynthesis monooxygenase n=1 Tax=Intrasporangium chromatireducens Q5-1 TaxID=584657 RepID=W9GSC9_9MICO|nr:hypothetical protein [Intrasporangium chromatireducens]EWT07733.1 antibiotic biosynthesis monooxygenase [Intrasporangium chromatireducens Q5-1]